jgi:hypothetical protein
VVYACNPSYLGGTDLEDYGSRPVQADRARNLISKITRANKRYGSSSRAPVSKVQSSEFKLQSIKNKVLNNGTAILQNTVAVKIIVLYRLTCQGAKTIS